ncbi:hypothetical protein D3C72_2264420 [compost metagenome]
MIDANSGVEVARAFFLRLPDTPTDADPTVQAAVERRIDRLLDDAARRIVMGRPASDGMTGPGA